MKLPKIRNGKKWLGFALIIITVAAIVISCATSTQAPSTAVKPANNDTVVTNVSKQPSTQPNNAASLVSTTPDPAVKELKEENKTLKAKLEAANTSILELTAAKVKAETGWGAAAPQLNETKAALTAAQSQLIANQKTSSEESTKFAALLDKVAKGQATLGEVQTISVRAQVNSELSTFKWRVSELQLKNSEQGYFFASVTLSAPASTDSVTVVSPSADVTALYGQLSVGSTNINSQLQQLSTLGVADNLSLDQLSQAFTALKAANEKLISVSNLLIGQQQLINQLKGVEVVRQTELLNKLIAEQKKVSEQTRQCSILEQGLNGVAGIFTFGLIKPIACN